LIRLKTGGLSAKNVFLFSHRRQIDETFTVAKTKKNFFFRSIC
jgi:hypothetical protein